MNEQFKKLAEDSKHWYENEMSKSVLEALRRLLIEVYPQDAHFIYELLQNADDAGSTEARFELCEDKLVFAHKGEHTRHFTVSPIETKANDVGTERYGSVNALSDSSSFNIRIASARSDSSSMVFGRQSSRSR